MFNAELEAMVNTSDEWIQARTGIRQRHIAAADETTCDMAEQAARRAIEAANITTDSIDLIVLATSTPDHIFPSTACLLQARLGINTEIPAFDIQAVCSGFVYALSVADKFIRCGDCERVLVVGADTNSKILDWTDRGTCVIFGDGAGALVLQADTRPGIYSTHLHADGSHSDLLYVPGGASKPNSSPVMHMKGNEVFRIAVKKLDELVDETLRKNDFTRDDIDWLVPHQANIRIISATAKRLEMPMEKVVLTVAEHGNTSGGSIPLALDTAVRKGDIKSGDLLLLEAFGGGFTWGSALIRY